MNRTADFKTSQAAPAQRTGSVASRVAWIDIARGIGILLVVTGHMTSHEYGVSRLGGWIYSFHMPLFFFLSGCLFRSAPRQCSSPASASGAPAGRFAGFGAFLRHKAQTMLIPYFLLGLVLVLSESLRTWYYEALARGIIPSFGGTSPVRGGFTGIFLTNLINLIVQDRHWAIWFLAALFGMEILFWILRRLIPSDILLTIVTAGITAAGLLYYHLGGGPLPWDLDVVPTTLIFYLAGHLAAKRRWMTRFLTAPHQLLRFIICAAVNLAALHLTWKISGTSLELYFCHYGFAPPTYLAAFAGILAACIMSAGLARWNGRFRAHHPAHPGPGLISYIGSHSLLYFAWHETLFIVPLRELVLESPQIAEGPFPARAAACIAVWLFTILTLTFLDRLIRRSPLVVMLTGRLSSRASQEISGELWYNSSIVPRTVAAGSAENHPGGTCYERKTDEVRCRENQGRDRGAQAGAPQGADRRCEGSPRPGRPVRELRVLRREEGEEPQREPHPLPRAHAPRRDHRR